MSRSLSLLTAVLVLAACGGNPNLPADAGDCDANPAACANSGLCSSDSQCAGAKPRCDRNSGKCVVCLPINDNCGAASRCVDLSGAFTCVGTCASAADCPHADSGASQACCTSACIDTDRDPLNCGGCGKVCPSVSNGVGACRAGACAIDHCNAGFADCDNNAVNGCEAGSVNDANNCGGCGRVCPPARNSTPVCQSGTCSAVCSAGFLHCSANPQDGCEVDKNTDLRNCGGCGVSCGALANATGACAGGSCTIATCNFGYADCNRLPVDGCEANLLSATSCGSCGVMCGALPNASPGCNGGNCGIGACATNFGDCDNLSANGCEKSLAADLNNCGACRSVCALANATPACLGGQCGILSCNAGWTDCDKQPANGCESQTANDPLNCGGCNILCPTAANATPRCMNSSCSLSCQNGYADCDGNKANGCETNLRTSAGNCGGCGTVCGAVANGTSACNSGFCGLGMCNPNYGDCNGNPGDGCEKYLATDIANCGSCGTVCAYANAKAACLGSQCGLLSCNAGYGDCDNNPANGCEIKLNTDVNNCGQCGTVCPLATPYCVSGACASINTKVLLICSMAASPTYCPDIQAKIKGTGAFVAVDYFDAFNGTPMLTQLAPYGSVLVTSAGGFKDATTLGNVLADYFDGGGSVVVATFANSFTVAGSGVLGRFGTAANGYLLASWTGSEMFADTLGTVVEPASPLMAGVSSLSCSNCERGIEQLQPGAVVVARWASNGQALVVRGVVKGRNRVDLNFWPPSLAVSATYGWQGDGAILMKNALLYR